MNITSLPVTLVLPPSKTPRSPGLHLSTIIRDMAITAGLLEADIAEGLGVDQMVWWNGLEPFSQIAISFGLAWEEWYIPTQIPDVVDHPGEVESDGIFMTPDAETIELAVYDNVPSWVLAVHEVKKTFKSSKTIADIRKQWMWVTQLMSYCRAKGTTRGYLHVACNVGDYKVKRVGGPFSPEYAMWNVEPQLFIWRFDFTEHQLDENWQLILDYVASKPELCNALT